MKVIQENFRQRLKFAIIVSRFNDFITGKLLTALLTRCCGTGRKRRISMW
jgi:6,7-dimethyl-8-ribityllumazine synthase